MTIFLSCSVLEDVLYFLLGYTSLRNKTSGSRYVKSIVKVFMNKACDTDIRTMLDEVCVLTIIKVYALILMVGHYKKHPFH